MVTVSADEGIELYEIQDEPFTAADVISHLRELRDRNEKMPLAILLD